MAKTLKVDKVIRSRIAYRILAGSLNAFDNALEYVPSASGAMVVLEQPVKLDAKKAVKVGGDLARAWPVSIEGSSVDAHLVAPGKHMARQRYMLVSTHDLSEVVTRDTHLEVA